MCRENGGRACTNNFSTKHSRNVFHTLETYTNYLVGEGQSTVRPPLFVGDNYAYWKTRMKLFIQANDYEVWRIILNGPIIPTKKVEDQEMVKQEDEWGCK